MTRPEPVDHKKKFSTPDWSSRGFCNTCPRDSMLVIGDEIIETPMAWPCRYFETHSYRPLLKDYFRRGARWTSAPKPQLTGELFDPDFRLPEKGAPMRYILTEFEPVFDAADFFRCGRDLFVTRSNVTNASGIEWLRRHLGETYRIHEIESRCPNPMHIDTTVLPLGPGKLLINPEYIDPDRLPDILKRWDISGRARSRSDHRSRSQHHLAVRQVAQHEHPDDRRKARDRRSASCQHDARHGKMGI